MALGPVRAHRIGMSTPSAAELGRLVAATPDSRNRAIDAYRAGAMVAVAIGHWLVAAVVRDGHSIRGVNALDYVSSLHWMTWLFQVMPLFFCIGGYSNAASLDAHHRAGGSSADWVAARLRRLTQPTKILAATWLVIVCLTLVTGVGRSLAFGASAAAAIPLWFMANYVADTALAPTTLRLHRRHRGRFAAGLVAVFAVIELARLIQIPFVPILNAVLGWIVFQVLGFWWRDGLLPAARHLKLMATVSAVACAMLVAVGPWPLSMVRVPSQPIANTWPPSAPLLLFGLAYCSIAIAVAPAVDAWLRQRRAAWTLVVAANSVTMTVYLWHFTAITVAGGVFYASGRLTHAPVGSAPWWWNKAAMMVAAALVLAAIVALVGKHERRGLLAAQRGSFTNAQVAALSTMVAVGFEVWTLAGTAPPLILVGTAALVTASRMLHA